MLDNLKFNQSGQYNDNWFYGCFYIGFSIIQKGAMEYLNDFRYSKNSLPKSVRIIKLAMHGFMPVHVSKYVSLYVFLSVYLSISSSLLWSLDPVACKSVSVYLYICLSVRPSIYLFRVYLSVSNTRILL